MNSNHFYVVLMAGGEGTRFAPLSTPEKPKQFLCILDSAKTMIQQAYERVIGLVPRKNCFVSTNLRYVDLVQNQLQDIPRPCILGEPIKKNTAPAMILLTYLIAQTNPEAVILWTPCDHYMHDQNHMRECFRKALEFASDQDLLVTFGVPPTFASTDYGYLKLGQSLNGVSFLRVDQFVEKPNAELARQYLQSGSYVWNSGIFVWKGRVLLKAVQKYMPELALLLDTITVDKNATIISKDSYRFFDLARSISIDYGIMEKADNVCALPFPVGWSDVGTWEGLFDLSQRYQLELPESVNRFFVQKNFKPIRG